MNYSINIDSCIFSYKESLLFELKKIACEFRANSLNAIVGKSGSGKTSLLNLMCGLEKLTMGEIMLDGKSIVHYSTEEVFSKISYISIDNNNLHHLTVEDNLRLVCNDTKRINSVLSFLKLNNLNHMVVAKLSKGEQQRVSLARAVLSEKEAILIDEPTANVDHESALLIFELIKQISRSKNVIIVTHEVELAQKYCDHIIELDNGLMIREQFISENIINSESIEILEKDTVNKISKWISFKVFLNQFYRKKISYIISLILITVSMISVFVSTSFMNTDERKTLISGINNLQYDVYQVGNRKFTIEQNPKDFMEETNSFRSFTLSSSYDEVHIHVTFNTDVTAKIIGKDINNYEIDSSIFSDTENVHYYPIIVNEQLLHDFARIHNRFLQINDVLPATFHNTTNDKDIKFIIVDTFEIKNQFNEQSTLFPSIISRTAYLDNIQRNGIDDLYLSDSINEILFNYNDFCDDNGFSKDKYIGIGLAPASMIKPSLISDIFYDYDEVPSTGGYYLAGRLPESEDEIVIYDNKVYDIIGLGVNRNPALENYFATYQDGYEVTFDESFPETAYPASKVKIVGSYGYKYPESYEGERFKRNNHIIIHDSFYDRLFQLIDLDYYDTQSQINIFYISKKYIANHIDSILANDITVFDDIDTLTFYLQNSERMSTFLMYLSFVLLLLCTCISMIFIFNYIKRASSDMCVLYVNGLSRKYIMLQSLFILLIAYVSTVIIAIFISPMVTTFIDDVVISSGGFVGSLVYDSTSSYLNIFIFFTLFIIVSAFPMTLITRNKILHLIKKG